MLTAFRMTVRRVHTMFLPLNCRWAVTFEAPKVTKSASSSEGFFAARALYCKHAKPGPRSFCPCFAPATLQQKFAMPCRAQGHHRFACFRPKLSAEGEHFHVITRNSLSRSIRESNLYAMRIIGKIMFRTNRL